MKAFRRRDTGLTRPQESKNWPLLAIGGLRSQKGVLHGRRQVLASTDGPAFLPVPKAGIGIGWDGEGACREVSREAWVEEQTQPEPWRVEWLHAAVWKRP